MPMPLTDAVPPQLGNVLTFTTNNTPLKKFLGGLILKVLGWKCTVKVSPEMKHCVMVAAPHTTNWDFPIAISTFWVMGVDVKFFIKDNYTKGPLGFIFKALGALGVDRSKAKNGLTDYAIDRLKETNELVVLVPAEGTRKWVEKWRTGFYRIAMEANVPISLGYLDYEKKEAGVADVFYPSGDFEKDMTYIQEVYRPIKGKNPENYNPRIF